MQHLFQTIRSLDVPETLQSASAGDPSPEFVVSMQVDGVVPFAQVIVWYGAEQLAIVRAEPSVASPETYTARVPRGVLRLGEHRIQAEGCRRADLERAGAADWIKAFRSLSFTAASVPLLPKTVATGG